MAESTRVPLSSGQQLFFQRNRTIMLQIEAAMKGALQLISDEHGLTGRSVSLSEDGTELIVDEVRP